MDDGIEGYQDIGEEEDWTAEPEPEHEAERPLKERKKGSSKEEGHKGEQCLSCNKKTI